MANDWTSKLPPLKDDLSVSLDYAVKKDPVGHAKTLKSAREINAPIDLAERNPDEVRQLAEKKELERKLKDTNTLKRAFKDMDFAAAAREDVDNLKETESLFEQILGYTKGAEKIPKRAMAGMAGVPRKFSQGAAATLDFIAQTERNIWGAVGSPIAPGRHILDPAVSFLRGEEGPGRDFDLAIEHALGIRAEDTRIPAPTSPSKYWRKDAIGDNITTEAALQGIESFFTMAPGMTLSLATGRPHEALAWGMGMEFGAAAEEAKEAGLDPTQVFTYAATQGAIEGITEKLPMGWLISDLKMGTSFGKTLVKQMAAEIPGEQAATFLQDFNTFATLRPEATFGNFMRERPAAAYQTLISSMVGTSLNVTTTKGTISVLEKLTGQTYPETLGEQSRAQAAFQRGETLAAMERLAKDSRLKEVFPEIYEEHLEQIEAQVDHVYIDGEELFQILEENDITLDDLKDIKGISDQAEEIAENGGDFQISLSEYMSKIAGTDIGEILMDHARFNPEDMSLTEAKQWQEQEIEKIIEEGEKIIQEMDDQQDFIESADRVEEYVRDQLIQSGRQSKEVATRNAAIHKAFAVTMAERFPEQFPTPEAVYERYGLEVMPSEIAGAAYEQKMIEMTPEEVLPFATDEPRLSESEATRLRESLINEGIQNAPVLVKWLDSSTTLENGNQRTYQAIEAGIEKMPIIMLEQEKGESDLDMMTRVLEEVDAQREILYQKRAVKAPWEMTREEFDAEEVKGMGVTWLNAVKADDGTIYTTATREHADLIQDLQDEELIGEKEKPQYRGWVWKGLDKEESFIDVSDLAKTKTQADFYEAYKNKARELGILYQRKRGKIQFPKDITKQPSLISLLEDADLSTFLHESGHFFFEVMKDMALLPDAPEQLKNDLKALVNFAGVESVEEWSKMSLEQRREGHEKVAEAFEVYLFEGKAPSLELQSLFQTFRAWLVNAYRQMRQYLSADKLTDEVRQVFDRMLATDAAIEFSERSRGYAPLFESAEEAGVTQEQWDEYQEELTLAHQDAIEEIQTRSLRDLKYLAGAKARELKKLQGQAWKLRKKIKEEVAAEVINYPVYQAMELFKKGKLPGEEEAQDIKLNTDALKEMYENRDDWIRLAHEKMTRPGGVHPDDIAQSLGFTSGDAMVKALVSAPTFKQMVNDLTDQRMMEEHADLATKEAIAEAADQAVYNAARAKIIATEAKFLSKLAKRRGPDTKALKELAKAFIAELQIKDIKPGRYEAQERKAAKAVLEAWKKGDHEEAAIQGQRQLLNHLLVKESRKALERVDKSLKYVKKFDKQGTRKNIDPEQLDQIDDLRQGFDFSNMALKEIAKRQSLNEWIESQEDFDPAIDADFIEQIKRRNYKTLTFEELQGLIDSIKNIEHVGRLKKKLLTAKDKREFEERMDEAKESIKRNANRTVEEKATATDVFGRFLETLDGWTSEHRKAASIIREMDASMDGGVMWDLYIRPMNEAGDKETRMRAEASERMAELFDPILKKISRGGLPGNIYAQKMLIPGTDISMTYEQRLMFGMNWGNLGNRQRLLDGGLGGKRGLSDAEAQAILNTLDKEDWDFIQSVWDYLEEFKPQIAEQEKRLTGVTPEWIESAEVVTEYGVYKGGYFPAKYDSLLSTRSASQEAATNLRQSMKGSFNAAATKKGYTQKRAEEVKGRPILLSFNAISEHVNDVVHRLSWQDWLTDANRILKALDDEIREHYGVKILNQLQNLHEDIARGEAAATHFMEKLINHVRIGTTIQGMGFRLTTAMIQPTGFAQSWFRIGAKWLALGLARFMRNPISMSDLANEKSSMMRDRSKTLQREVNEIMNVARAGKKLSTLSASYFILIYKMQRMVDLPTWWGAYEKAQKQLGAQNATTEEERQEIESKAVAMADQAVLDAQGGGQIKDLARIQRGSPFLKLWTNFYSYFNTTYNLNVEAFRRTSFKRPDHIARLLVDLVILNIVPVILAVIIRQMMTGECEDMKCMAEKTAKEQSSYLFGQMVGLREMGGIADYFIGGQGFGYQGPAGIRIIGETYRLAQRTAQGKFDEKWWKSASTIGGILGHLPMGQIYDTAEGLMSISAGEAKTPVEAAQRLMTGD